MHIIDIINDSQLFAIALANTLKSISNNFTFGKIWQNAPEFLMYIKTKNATLPDLVLIDYRMHFLLGSHLSYILERDSPEIKKIGISADAEPDWVGEFLASECMSFVDKGVHPRELQTAIENVLYGRLHTNIYVDEKKIIRHKKSGFLIDLPFNLTDNEYLYIQLCQSPLTNDAIANVLSNGKESLHKKQQKLFKQFNVKSRAELVNFAIAKKIIWIFRLVH